MLKVALYHAGIIMHYRVGVYNFFSKRFESDGIDFTVLSSGVEMDCNEVRFKYYEVVKYLDFYNTVSHYDPDVLIVFSGLKNHKLFPLIAWAKLKKIKVVYWGHGINLSKINSLRYIYIMLHRVCDAIILYSEREKKYIDAELHGKTFVAKNTIFIEQEYLDCEIDKKNILLKYGIYTEKNIVFVGRTHARKKIDLLLRAYMEIGDNGVGLVIVGPDAKKYQKEEMNKNVRFINGLYGKDLIELLRSMDIYCCPGWVGLNIVDAMSCGLPFVTVSGEHAPEIMYLKDDVNGLLVKEEKVMELKMALKKLLNNDNYRAKLSGNALKTFKDEASIQFMYKGFINAIKYLSGKEM